jgi:hypothetical protein
MIPFTNPDSHESSLLQWRISSLRSGSPTQLEYGPLEVSRLLLRYIKLAMLTVSLAVLGPVSKEISLRYLRGAECRLPASRRTYYREE